jgi:hypothetical protein
MKKLVFLIFLCLYGFSLSLLGQTRAVRNNVGFGIAYIPPLVEGIYFDDPWDFWPNREPSMMLQVSYARQVNQSVRTGIYLEYEKIRFSTGTVDTNARFRRYNMGLDWIGQFPTTALHMQLGGYIGFGYLMAHGWDNLTGFDFGMIAGPAYETEHIGISAQVRSGYAPYNSSGTPSGVLLFNPKFLLKVYYKF